MFKYSCWGAGGAVVAALLLTSVSAISASDSGTAALFDGKSLTGWHVQGGADWRVTNGAIVGVPKNGAGGWLVLSKGYEDLVLRLTFQCNGECGVLLRRRSTEGGGASGVYAPLAGEAAGTLLQVALDGQGNETSRKPLTVAGNPRPRIFSPLSITPGADGWTRAQIVLYGPVIPAPEDIRLRANWGSYRNLPFPPQVRVNFGDVALRVSSGELRVKEISVEDLIRRRTGMPAEATDPAFRKVELTPLYFTEGAAAADFNHDGIMDVVAGPYYYPGPDYKTGIEIYPPQAYATNGPGIRSAYTDSFMMFAHDFNGDGWPDVLRVNFEGAFLYVNPKTESRHWDAYKVVDDAASETVAFADIDGDGKPELVTFVHPGPEKRSGFTSPVVLGYFKPGPDPTKMWTFHAISTPAVWGPHSLGCGDINKDGRVDIVHGAGWWEQPAAGADSGLWEYHAAPFSRGGACAGAACKGGIADAWERGAQMFVYDVNGDGLPDVVTSLFAHGPGLAWYEQQKNAQGAISWKMHMIMDSPSASAEERKTWEETDKSVAFTELHALTMADMDGDGLEDIVTGKRWWSGSEYTQYHLDDPPVLYWFKLVRKRGGQVEFVPHMINNRADIGTQVIAVDLNGDGKPDVVAAARTGAFVFFNNLKKQ
jgi:hypothetical protein